MTEAHMRALFLLAGIQVIAARELPNGYWPDAYVEERKASPWWFVQTPAGWIEIGRRKRVISVNWSTTTIRVLVTADDVTKDLDHVHAYGYADCVRYLTELGRAITAATQPKEQP